FGLIISGVTDPSYRYLIELKENGYTYNQFTLIRGLNQVIQITSEYNISLFLENDGTVYETVLGTIDEPRWQLKLLRNLMDAVKLSSSNDESVILRKSGFCYMHPQGQSGLCNQRRHEMHDIVDVYGGGYAHALIDKDGGVHVVGLIDVIGDRVELEYSTTPSFHLNNIEKIVIGTMDIVALLKTGELV